MSAREPNATPPPPPADEFPPEDIVIRRGQAWFFTACFLLLLGVPPLLQDLREWKKGDAGWLPARELGKALTDTGSKQPIAERLRGWDAGIARLEFMEAPRRVTQQHLTALTGRGNDRVLLGKDGWLFYRPEIQALTGYGPVTPEPHSVSRDPSLLDWEYPLAPITEFAADLRERGVELWLAPVPMKPSIYPEKLTGHTTDGPVRHPEAAAFFTQLRAAGVHVVDLAPALWTAKAQDAAEGPVYLPDDTHWTPRGMRAAAATLAAELRKAPWLDKLPAGKKHDFPLSTTSLPGFGDLVEKLDPADAESLFTKHNYALPLAPDNSDAQSPLVLLGDSFVNLYDDAALGFRAADTPAGQRTGAGLAGALAADLGVKIDVHAVNGDGASGVRQWLMRRGETVVRSKRAVLWVIAERDLFLSRTVAKANRVTWERAPVSADPAAPASPPAPDAAPQVPVTVEAVVLEKSEQADPRAANYANAIYCVKYWITRTLSGTAPEGEITVAHWNFQNRVASPAGRVEVGKTYRLTLDPWAAKTDLHPVNLEDFGEDPAWWSATAEPAAP